MKKVYLDYSATTPLDKRVLDDMMPYLTDVYGNANSVHSFGQEASYAVDNARRTIAECINAKRTEVYFTSGGTEANNWAIKGISVRYGKISGRNHIITSAIEHPSILESVKYMSNHGFEVTYLPVNSDGIIEEDVLRKAISEKTVLVSIMTANNEIGSIQPIKELAKIAHEYGALFHTDAVQAMNSIKADVRDTNVDLMSFSGHKIYGPKGVGVLYVKSGIKPDKFMIGGHQERTMRGGTTNVPAVVGMASALKYTVAEMEENKSKIRELQNQYDELLSALTAV